MKKLITLFFGLLMVLCLCSCGGSDNTSSQTITDNVQSQQPDFEDVADDETVDPENVEDSQEDGAEVQIKDVHAQSGQALGIDVSKWQGKIDWQRVKAAGIDFAIIRIGYRGENGTIYRDANADYNIQQAQKAGVLVGVYFFSTAKNQFEAEEEAVWTTKAIKGYKISYPVVYDCEGFQSPDSRMYGLSVQERTENAVAFLNFMRKSDYDTMLYGSKSDFESNQWDMQQLEQNYKIWVAHYSTPTYPQRQNPDYNRKYDMWQYTNRGSVDGVEGGCDMIVSYFKASEQAAVDADATPNTAPPPKTQEEMLYTDTGDRVTAKEEVNLRAGAGTNFEIVGTLKSGEFVKRIGKGSNGWSKLEYKGKTVYAITSYLSNEVINVEKPDIVGGMTFTPKSDRVTAKVEVNLRKTPSTDGEKVGLLRAGEFVSRTAISDKGWSRLTYNGQTVYAVTSYLTNEVQETNKPQDGTVTEHGMTFNPVSTNVTAKEETNLRDRPSTTDSTVIYTLKNGEYVQKTGESKDGWARLIYNGQTVYAINSFLTN